MGFVAGGVAEYRIRGVAPVANPFNPNQIRVDVMVAPPRGLPFRMPAFWYQPFTSRMDGGSEVLDPAGPGEWRVRVGLRHAGRHVLSPLASGPGIRQSGRAVALHAAPRQFVGFIARDPNLPHGLVSHDGTPFLAIGANVSWHGPAGTRDYAMWVRSLAEAGSNYMRLWMCPWAFGAEAQPGTLNRYDQQALWRLDYAFHRGLEHQVQIMLCLDYHGMLSQTPDFWGANDNWKINPYNQVNGGPAANPGEFFTHPVAREFYKKRLRYLVARYGGFSNLMAWEFWNELDNVYPSFEKPAAVEWHREMAAHLKALDPYDSLVTTSLTHMPWPELWSLRDIDITQWHSYGQASPATELARRMRQFMDEFGKPALVSEFGIDFRGPATENDPEFRALRQASWGVLHAGSAGSAHPWWWETIHAQGRWGVVGSPRAYAERVGLAGKRLTPARFTVPELIHELRPRDPAGSSFDLTLTLNPQWGADMAGTAYLNDRHFGATYGGRLGSFVHGSSHSNLRRPLIIHAHFARGAQLTLRLNSVSTGAVLQVLVDGAIVLQRDLPDRDGQTVVNDEYGEEIVVPIPSGTRRVEVRNSGADWFYLDWVRLTRLETSIPPPGGMPLHGVGSRSGNEVWLYLIDVRYHFPSSATEAPLTLSGGSVVLHDLPDGTYTATWTSPVDGSVVGQTTATSTAGRLELIAPDFRIDLALWLAPRVP